MQTFSCLFHLKKSLLFISFSSPITAFLSSLQLLKRVACTHHFQYISYNLLNLSTSSDIGDQLYGIFFPWHLEHHILLILLPHSLPWWSYLISWLEISYVHWRISSISPEFQASIYNCLLNIPTGKSVRHFTLNMFKTELLVPHKPALPLGSGQKPPHQHWLMVSWIYLLTLSILSPKYIYTATNPNHHLLPWILWKPNNLLLLPQFLFQDSNQAELYS